MDLKKPLAILQRVSPKLTANLALRFITKPKQRKMRPSEKSIENKSIQTSIKFKEFKIKVFKWGNGEKKALMVHGWGGRAANYGAIIPKLLENGFEITSFDGPSHGGSTKRKTSPFDLSELIQLLLDEKEYDLVVTHSMGSVLTLLAMSNLNYKANQVIILTTPNSFLEFIEMAVLHFGLTAETTKLLINWCYALK